MYVNTRACTPARGGAEIPRSTHGYMSSCLWLQMGVQEPSSKHSKLGEIRKSTLESVPSGKRGDEYVPESGVCGTRGYVREHTPCGTCDSVVRRNAVSCVPGCRAQTPFLLGPHCPLPILSGQLPPGKHRLGPDTCCAELSFQQQVGPSLYQGIQGT